MRRGEIFETIQLQLDDGSPVAKVEIPRFRTPPAVIQWGDRVFTRRPSARYAEAFCYFAPLRLEGQDAAPQYRLIRVDRDGRAPAVDRKFWTRALCTEHDGQHDEGDSVLFLAKDRALIPTLFAYLGECERLGASARQLAGISLLIERVRAWQAAHPEQLKVADVDAGPAGDAIVNP